VFLRQLLRCLRGWRHRIVVPSSDAGVAVAMRGPALRSWLGDFVLVSSPSSFVIRMDLPPPLPPWRFFCCLCGCCYWVAFLIEDGDARSLLPLSTSECSGRCPFNVLSTTWRIHGVDYCGGSKAWSYSLVSAGSLLPGFNAQCFFNMVQSGGEQRRSVVFSNHGVAFFVICVISRVVIRKRICILL
jgi:hypothetical protein